MRNVLSLFVLCLFVLGPTAALADVLPTPEDCTVAKKQRQGVTCEECADSIEDPCEERYDLDEWQYACSQKNPTIEVWCDGTPRTGCSVAGAGAASLGALLLAALGLAAFRRRDPRAS